MLPDRADLPRYLAPLPERLEDLALRHAWVVVAVNLLGTAFGFWYYGFHPLPVSDPLITWQFAAEPPVTWPLVPDSPVATFFVAASLALWKLGRSSEVVNALAFFGCLKLGLWTPFTLLAFMEGFSYNSVWMYNFLFWSHLGMVAEAFVIHRYSDFPVGAVAVAVIWYGVNDAVDYFLPVVGTPHHTRLPGQEVLANGFSHPSPTHEVAAAGAVVITIAATLLALATRKSKSQHAGG